MQEGSNQEGSNTDNSEIQEEGSSCKGEIVNYTFQNNDRYEGCVFNEAMSGWGRYTFTSRNIEKHGFWNEGNFVFGLITEGAKETFFPPISNKTQKIKFPPPVYPNILPFWLKVSYIAPFLLLYVAYKNRG